MLFTSHNRDFDDPDSLVIATIPFEMQLSDTLGLGRKSFVIDLDNDGRLDWVQPHWQFDRSDTTFWIHLCVYDPDSLILLREYVEVVQDIFYSGMSGPFPIQGVSEVDINNDGIFEILLAIQGRPLRIIDSQTMEVIMSSDYVIGDYYNWVFDVGYFDDSGRLQFLIREDYDLVVYNLPEEWSIPREVRQEEHPMPRLTLLSPAYPNPFNSTTRLNYNLPANMDITVSVFNTLGQQVQVLDNGLHQAGSHHVVWNAENSPSGVYFVRLNTPQVTQESRVLLVK